jgi:hypothetical protein
MNSSYPLVSKKNEFRKENETYAFLEKLKPAQKEENRIEHIHHMRYLDFLDYSFKRSEPDTSLNLKNNPEEVPLTDSETINPHLPAIPKTSELRKSLLRLIHPEEEHIGSMLPCGFVLTIPKINRNYLKSLKIQDFEGNHLTKNKFGPFITTEDFSLFTIKTSQSTLNPYISFKLKKLDKVLLLSRIDESYLSVIDITNQYFVFSSLTMQPFKPSEPVFSHQGELQGFYSHSVLNLHFAKRLEPIFAYLLKEQKMIKSEELDNFLLPYTRFYYS